MKDVLSILITMYLKKTLPSLYTAQFTRDDFLIRFMRSFWVLNSHQQPNTNIYPFTTRNDLSLIQNNDWDSAL